MLRLARSAALSFLVALSFWSRAGAENISIVIVPGDPDADIDGVGDAVRAAAFDPLELGETEGLWQGAATAERAREKGALLLLTAGIEDARAKYLEQEFGEMISALTSLRADTLWLTTRATHRAILWDLCFQIGLAHQARGDTSRAASEFALAAAIDGERRPPSDIYGPDVGQTFASALAASGATAAQPFRVDAEPLDAQIAIDGVPLIDTRGRSLTPGLHVVRVSAPGYREVAAIVDTRAGSTSEISLEALDGSKTESIGAAWARGELRPGAASSNAALSALASEKGAEVVLWVGSGSPAEVIALDAAGLTTSASAATAKAAAAAVLARLDARGRIGGRDGLITDPGPAPSSRRKWLVIGGIGAAVVVVAVAAIALSGGGGGGGRIEIGIVP